MGARLAVATPAAAATPTLHLGSNRPASCPAPASDANSPNSGTISDRGSFPWPPPPPGIDPTQYQLYDHTAASSPPVRPANWSNDGNDWKLTSARATADPRIYSNPQELCGVMGSSLDRAWQVSTGRPTTVIAVLDSGIEWCRSGLVDKIYLNRAALPAPEYANGTTRTAGDPYDLNGDGVFNVEDYAQDPRVTTRFCGAFVSPEDLIKAFGGLGRSGPPGFTEAIAGWNFLDDSNDPYDDVHYDHGSGEAGDSTGAANSSGPVGACPNCMVLPVRVGDSFIASANDFAQGVLFAVDSGAAVIQEALGTYDQTGVARAAIDYANAHGVPVVASAADEEAEHHNQPGALPHTIVVNSVTKYPDVNGTPLYDPASWLYLNGCTNYGQNVAVSVESASCSSEATGKASGAVGLAISAAADQVALGKLKPYPGITTVSGAPVPLSANEVYQLMTQTADDVDFLTPSTSGYGPPANYAVAAPVPTTRYPSQPGYDMYFGYGRLDAAAIVQRVQSGDIPPEAQLDSPDWFRTLDPSASVTVSGLVGAIRAGSYRYEVQVAAGPQPLEPQWVSVASGSGSGRKQGPLASIPGSTIASLFPPGSDFGGTGTLPGGRPNPDAFTFSIRVVVQDDKGRVGADRRSGFLHHDPALLNGQIRHFSDSLDGSPALAPAGPGGMNLLFVATSGGTVHALAPDGRELNGWPVQTAVATTHQAEPGYQKVPLPHGTLVGGVAVGDLFHDGHLEVLAADLTGRVYAWNLNGQPLPGFPMRTLAQYSGPPVRDQHNRLLRGIFGAPALADLEGTGKLDIVAAAADRHVYAWRPDGTNVPGFPRLVVDMSRVATVDPTTNKVTFKTGSNVAQGSKLLDTPAVGALSGSGRPDIVVGANEEYYGPVNASIANPIQSTVAGIPLLKTSNSRVYALDSSGNLLPGWPAAVGDYVADLLPVVGDGTPNSPALGDLDGSGKLRVGVITTVGPGYVLNPDATSYYGNGPDGKPKVLSVQPVGPASNSPAAPSLPALGGPVFAPLGAAGMSMVAPATSLGKAIDALLPAQQQPNDVQLDAWSIASAHFQPGYPQVVNDLEFLTQPIVANLAAGGPYIVTGDALADVRAVNAAGLPAPGFPKFTGGWSVNSPVFGPWGHLDSDVLVVGTREGDLFVWTTSTAACADPGPWPRGHHDNWNTNNLQTAGAPAYRCKPGS